MARLRKTRRPRALGGRRPPSSFGRNRIGSRLIEETRPPIAVRERLRDSIARTSRQESTSPSYSIPSACSWALQSNGGSIRRVSAWFSPRGMSLARGPPFHVDAARKLASAHLIAVCQDLLTDSGNIAFVQNLTAAQARLQNWRADARLPNTATFRSGS
jgi:hypothetical protein